MARPGRAILALALLVTVGVVLAAWFRIHYGVDVSDEAFYLVMPLRFVLGDKPFVDELNIAQTAGVIVWPFVGAYYKLTGGTQGLVLAARTLLLVLQAGVGVAAFRSLRRAVDEPAAVLIGASCILFWPANLPGLSYNTLGCTFFTLGLLLPLGDLLEGRAPPRWVLLTAGAAHALASFSYPTLVIPVLLYTSLLLWQLRDEPRRFVFYLGGAVSIILAVLPLFVRAGISGLRDVIAYSFAGGVGGKGKLALSLKEIYGAVPVSPWIIPALLVVIGVGCRWAPRVMKLVLFALPLLAAWSSWEGNLRTAAFLIYYSLLAVPVGLTLRDREFARRVLLLLWLPAFFGGLITMWTSTNNGIAGAVGLFPGALASSVLLARATMEMAPATRAYGAPASAPLVVLLIMVNFLYKGECIYRDGPTIDDLPARVERGPYRGLWTSTLKLRLLDDVDQDLLPRIRRGGRAVFYYAFPAGYLITAMRPAVASSWVFPNETRLEIDAKYFTRHSAERVLVFKLRDWVTRLYGTHLDLAIEQRCKLVKARYSFDLYEEKD